MTVSELIKELEKMPQDYNVAIESMTITYTQQCDSNEIGKDEYEVQQLVVSTEHCLEKGDANGGYYYTIKTDRWAFDDIEEFVNILEDFKKRLNNESEDKETE